VESVVHQHLTAEPRAITQLRPAVPPQIAGVLQRALAKNPADRFNPVAQFSDALRHPSGAAPVIVERWPRGLVAAAATVIVTALVVVGFVIRAGRGGEPLPGIGRTIQVTREPGLEVDAAISPDGQLVAYAAGPPTGMQIFVRQVTGGRTVRLTADANGNNRWPRWSPDGSRIAFQAMDGVYVVPALGGAPRLVARIPPPGAGVSIGSYTPLAGLAWSPDGTRIAFAGNLGIAGLWIVDANGGEPTRLDAPLESHSPAWSPDGTRLAVAAGNAIFVFGMTYFANAGVSSIWVVPVDGGAPLRVTGGRSLDGSPQWSPDGRSLFFMSDRGGSRDVYRIAADGRDTPVRMTTGIDAQSFTLSPDATHLAYARLQSSSNIWSLPMPSRGPVSADQMVPVTTGTQTIESVDVTRDGRWLVFDSDRNGNADLYKLSTDGGEAVQLTTDSAGDFSAVWSPDGTRIAFHSMRTGNRDAFTMNADGTGLVRRTTDPRHELDPSWSPDGTAIVVEIIDTDDWTRGNFIVVPVDGQAATARQLVGVGDFAEWSPGGDVIAFHASDGIRVMGLEGDSTRLLVSNAADGSEAFYGAWSLDGRVLYYLTRGDRGWLIRGVPRTGGPSRILVRFEDPDRQPARYGFATDDRRFYLTLGSHESDVWVLGLEQR
jgi:Tol biopolymer transport system component